MGTLFDVYQSDCLDPAHLFMLPAFALSGARLSFSGAKPYNSALASGLS